ncbi:MAG: hypothetical protein WC449_04950 [Candidatus Paceibacterota bacterium]
MKTLIRRLKNIIRWLPILWNDADFDYGYLLDILSFKLHNMQEFFANDKLTVCIDAKDLSIEIGDALDALKRYLNDDYNKQWYDLLYEKHGYICGTTNPFRLHFPDSTDNDRALKIWQSLNRRSDDLKQQDFEFVFNTLKEKLQNWWD